MGLFVRNTNTDQEQGKDCCLGMIIPDVPLQNIRTGAAPEALDVDEFVTAVVMTYGSTQTYTILAQPDIPRPVSMTLVDGGSIVKQINAIVRGTDYWGNVIFERLVTTLGGGNETVLGTRIFRSITSITSTNTGAAGASTVSFGIYDAIGLHERIREESDILAKRIDAVQDTTGVIFINPDGSAIWTPASVPDAARKYYATIQSRYGING